MNRIVVFLLVIVFSNLAYGFGSHSHNHAHVFHGNEGYTPHNYSNENTTHVYESDNNDSKYTVKTAVEKSVLRKIKNEVRKYKKTTVVKIKGSENNIGRQRIMNEDLARVKQNYEQIILKGQPDPYPKLMEDRSKHIVAGPEGSNLLALVKIKNSGKGRYYAKEANRQLAHNKDVQSAMPLKEGQTLIVDESGKRNPQIREADGSITRLEWHHSPNHIGSVSLIEKGTHRLGTNKAQLHYENQKGGNEMFNTQYGK